MKFDLLELVGYVSSFLVLISLLMTSVVKFRVINGIGSLIFTVYAVLIRSYPTAVMNFCLVIINTVFLVKVLRKQVQFSITRETGFGVAGKHFVEFFHNDIQKFFPDHDFSQEDAQCFTVYADANPVGILTGHFITDDTLEVTLDYAAPSHRDCSVGTFLYEKLKAFGICTLRAHTGDPVHAKYLEKMGFVSGPDGYTKQL